MGTESICNRILSKHLIKKISKWVLMGMKPKCYGKLVKHFSWQIFTKHCQQMLFELFMYTVNHPFNHECLNTFPV